MVFDFRHGECLNVDESDDDFHFESRLFLAFLSGQVRASFRTRTPALAFFDMREHGVMTRNGSVVVRRVAKNSETNGSK